MLLRYILVIDFLLIFLSNISFITLITGQTYLNWVMHALYIISSLFFSFFIIINGKKVELRYIVIMLLGFLFHTYINLQIQVDPLFDSLKWIFIVNVIIAGRVFGLPRFSFYIVLLFFILHCFIAILENRLQSHIFDYTIFTEKFQEFLEASDFRAFGLMYHPLVSANVTIIIMSFLLISNNIKQNFKIILIIIGTYALFCFNSRAAILIWGFLLSYRLLFYNRKPIIAIVLGIIIFLIFLSDISFLIQQSSTIFGRLAQKNNLTDESTLTRIVSYAIFLNQHWSFEDIVYGGRIINIPGTQVSLENGVLLTLSWWGWFIGAFKVIFELIITYSCVKNYNIKDRFIVMIATWGCAFANNNSMNTFVFVFFVVSVLAVNALEKKEIKHFDNWNYAHT